MMMDSQEKALTEEQVAEQNVEQDVVENTENAESTEIAEEAQVAESVEVAEEAEVIERKQYDSKKEVLERVREIAHNEDRKSVV